MNLYLVSSAEHNECIIIFFLHLLFTETVKKPDRKVIPCNLQIFMFITNKTVLDLKSDALTSALTHLSEVPLNMYIITTV